MNETGVLGRFIPEFGRVVAMMQFNMYHHYTVDEHLDPVDRRAGRDRRAADRERSTRSRTPSSSRSGTGGRSTSPCSCTTSPRAGREDHSIAGAAIARKLGPRLRSRRGRNGHGGLAGREPPRRCRSVAQSRDLSDPKTIETFAATVQTIERLKLLLVLTIADIKAVGPGVWTGWKGELLRTLYLRDGDCVLSRRAIRNRLSGPSGSRAAQAAAPGRPCRTGPDAEFEAYAGALLSGLLAEDRTGRRRQLAHARFMGAKPRREATVGRDQPCETDRVQAA